MASLTIRKIPDDVKQDLREKAARNGRSLEDEARRALIALVRPESETPRKSIGQMGHIRVKIEDPRRVACFQPR